MTGAPHRLPLPDALRALALVAVLVVNTVGYATAPVGPHLGLRLPADCVWAAATQGVVAGLLVGAGRVLQGGHFLSDIVLAGLVMHGVCLLIRAGWLRWRLRQRLVHARDRG